MILESATCETVSCKGGQKCLVEEKTGRPRCVTCNLPCPEPNASNNNHGKRGRDTDGPVCGSNDKTYHSWCHMFMDACATGLVIETKASGPCRRRVETSDGHGGGGSKTGECDSCSQPRVFRIANDAERSTALLSLIFDVFLFRFLKKISNGPAPALPGIGVRDVMFSPFVLEGGPV